MTRDGGDAPTDPGRRRAVGALLLATTLASCLLLAEVTARLVEHVRARRVPAENRFVDAENVVPVFERIEDRGVSRYIRTQYHWIPNYSRFLAEKPADAYRVFSLGGSAAMGWPHDGEYSYPLLLEQKLQRLLPDRRIEMVNAAGNSYASYRVKIVFDEIVAYDPDLVLIYSGNNEFLEDVLYPSRVLQGDPLWKRLAVGRLVGALFEGGNGLPKRTVDVENYNHMDLISTRLSFAFGRASNLRRDPEQFRAVREHYRFNIESMVRSAREHGVDVMLLTVPVNLKDWLPNASLHRDGISGDELAAWQVAFREGYLALEAGRPADAVPALERARDVDPEYAEAWFHYGTALRQVGRIEEARRAFQQALRLDAYPFRALFNDDLREIAERLDIPLVDLERLLEGQAADGIIGFDVLLDYVHPTVVSNEQIAQWVLERLVDAHLLPSEPAVPPETVRIPIPEDAEARLRPLRGLFRQCLVMRQYQILDGIAERLGEAVRAEAPQAPPERQEFYRTIQGRVERAQALIPPYRRLLLAEKLGLREREFSDEEAERIFDAYVEMIRDLEGGRTQGIDFESFVPERSYRHRPPGWYPEPEVR